MAGRFARASLAEVTEACAAHLGGEEVRAYVVGRTSLERLLYAVTDRRVAVLRLPAGALATGVRPKALLGAWGRGEVEVEPGISSIRVGPYRAKVRFSERRVAAEVAGLAGRRP